MRGSPQDVPSRVEVPAARVPIRSCLRFTSSSCHAVIVEVPAHGAGAMEVTVATGAGGFWGPLSIIQKR